MICFGLKRLNPSVHAEQSQFSHSALIIQKKKKRERELFQDGVILERVMDHVVIIIIYIIKKCE